MRRHVHPSPCLCHTEQTLTLKTGSRLGPYEISGAVGAGGMGEVYRARDSRLGREVAIKVLDPAVAGDASRLARFEREARLSSSLNHPNIVTIHDFAQTGGISYIAMELVEGESLRSVLKAEPLALKKLLSIASQIAAGLAAAHAVGIVHRDLKPENVMVTRTGVAKILDFGLAKATEAVISSETKTDVQLSRAHEVMGTAAYMSPEQARAGPVDFRSDQFSFGLILFEMASGKNPFHRASTLETLAAIHGQEAPPLSELRPDLPDSLLWIVQRCLSKDPAERYASTEDLARELVHVRDHGDRHNRLAVQPSKNVVPWVIAAGALAIAISTGLLVVRRAPAPTGREVIHVALYTPEIKSIPYGEANISLAISPDGLRVVTRGTGADQQQRLWVRDLRSTTTKAIPGTENGFSPMWSPDGHQIAFFGDGKLKIIPSDGGPARVVCDAVPQGGLSWSTSGTILFGQLESGASGIFKVSPGAAAPATRVTRADSARHEVVHIWPEILPDGKHFLYLTLIQRPGETIQHILRVASLDGGTPKDVAAIDSRAVFEDGRLYYARDGALLVQPFDPDRLVLTGEAVSIVDRLHYFYSTGLADFGVSKNGTICYRTALGDSAYVWLDRRGVQAGELGRAIFGDGRLAPGGQRFAVEVVNPKLGTSDLWVYDLGGKGASRLTFESLDEKSPVWAADGRSLFYRVDAEGPPDIYRLQLDDNSRELVFRGEGVEQPSDISPDDGQLIFLEFSRTTGIDLWLLPLAGEAQPRPFIRTPFNEIEARFSPNGRWVAFTSELSGRAEVYLAPFPGRGSPIRVSSEGGAKPRWRGDGQELFYISPADDVMSVAIRSAAGTIDASEPLFLFRVGQGIASYEVYPDGSRFLVRAPSEDRTSPLQLVLNVSAETR